MRADWLRKCLVFLALGCGLSSPSAGALASQPLTAAAARDTGTTPHDSATGLAYFGILGEVACPGVYELPGACTFGRLVSCAGGATSGANGNALVLRGGRVAQQLFVGSSASALLQPGDLIVIERDGTQRSTAKPAGMGSAPQPAEVQLAFVNLLDRPIVVRMPGNQASPARIVELLRQPPALVDDLRILSPSRREARGASESALAPGLLPSSSVLIFPAHRVRPASLPPLPDPIRFGKPAIPAPTASAAAASSDSSSQAKTQPTGPVAEVGAHSVESDGVPAAGPPSQEQIERLIQARRASRLASRIPGALVRGERAREEFEAAWRPRTRPYLSFFVLAGTALLAMLATIVSMTRRWINVSRSPGRAQMAYIISPAPTFVEAASVSRPIRVDANLPQSRLGIDLAVLERARARQPEGAVAYPGSTPRAA